MDQQKEKKRIFSALDVFIALLVILAIAAVILRVAFNIGIGGGDDAKIDEYIVSYTVSSVRTTSSKYFARGTEFRIADGDVFGIAEGSVTITPAEYYAEGPDGKLILTYYPENGDDSLVDIKGTMKVSGAPHSSSGVFMLNGNMPIAPNSEIEIKSADLTVTVVITDITKIS